MTVASAAVTDRYRALRSLVDSVPVRPPSDPTLAASIASWVAHEARLLDGRRFEAWLDGFTDDAVVWVPIDPASDPGADQSLFLDDRRRLGERVAWRRDPSAWGQQPPSVCTRVIGVVEAWPGTDAAGTDAAGTDAVGTDAAGTDAVGTGAVVARSAFTVIEQRHGREQVLAGHQIHELVGEPLRCRTKILLVPRLGAGVRNPSFLL